MSVWRCFVWYRFCDWAHMVTIWLIGCGNPSCYVISGGLWSVWLLNFVDLWGSRVFWGVDQSKSCLPWAGSWFFSSCSFWMKRNSRKQFTSNDFYFFLIFNLPKKWSSWNFLTTAWKFVCSRNFGVFEIDFVLCWWLILEMKVGEGVGILLQHEALWGCCDKWGLGWGREVFIWFHQGWW